MSDAEKKQSFLSKIKKWLAHKVKKLSAGMSKIHSKLSQIKFGTKKSTVAILSSVLVVIVIITLMGNQHKKQQDEQSQQLNAAIYYQVQKSSKDLNLISSQVDALTDSLNNQHSIVELDTVKKSLEKMSQQIQSMKDENSDSLAQLMKNQSAEMNQKLDSLQEGVDAIRLSQKKVIYLPEKELPFLVESVDLIQQQPVVTVRYDYKSQPLDIGYSLAGWELVRADFSKQSAEFRNHKEQHILIHLTQRGSMA